MEAVLILIGIVIVAAIVWRSRRGIQVGMWVRLVDEDGSRVGKVKRVRGQTVEIEKPSPMVFVDHSRGSAIYSASPSRSARRVRSPCRGSGSH